MTCTFTHTIFYVPQVSETLVFFEKAFRLKPKFIHESGAYAELETGEVALAFADEALGAMNLPEGYERNDPKKAPQACEIALTTDDVEGVYKKALAVGAIDIASPKEKPWGQTVAYIRSPHGILIEIASPISGSA